jgi:hypothetical protein
MKKRKPEQPTERRTLHPCYVCNRTITGDPVYIGQELYRHKRCEPGSARWMQSARAEISDVTEYFVEGCYGN